MTFTSQDLPAMIKPYQVRAATNILSHFFNAQPYGWHEVAYRFHKVMGITLEDYFK